MPTVDDVAAAMLASHCGNSSDLVERLVSYNRRRKFFFFLFKPHPEEEEARNVFFCTSSVHAFERNKTKRKPSFTRVVVYINRNTGQSRQKKIENAKKKKTKKRGGGGRIDKGPGGYSSPMCLRFKPPVYIDIYSPIYKVSLALI